MEKGRVCSLSVFSFGFDGLLHLCSCFFDPFSGRQPVSGYLLSGKARRPNEELPEPADLGANIAALRNDSLVRAQKP